MAADSSRHSNPTLMIASRSCAALNSPRARVEQLACNHWPSTFQLLSIVSKVLLCGAFCCGKSCNRKIQALVLQIAAWFDANLITSSPAHYHRIHAFLIVIMATTTIPRLNISLEPHLAETLQPLLPLLPHEIASNLESALAQAARDGKHGVALIPYQLLHTISAWSRSSAGVTALSSHIPPLDLHSYSMVSLLAGTRTSPERKFPHTHSGQKDHEAEAKREINDRRAVVAVINAMLSILGSGAAVWWAAERLSWRDEWVSLNRLRRSKQSRRYTILLSLLANTPFTYLRRFCWPSQRRLSLPHRKGFCT